ncbi:MAG TPA: Sjogren's syndrome/scleroderma autoantigen 1 family protein [Nitrosopumilaceae archaeon]|nr:Sjogren's syndrome/scleroderma autoantigen 1 family protein [Nitrosopumilaceae archaeon]
MSDDFTKKAVEMLLQGATMLREPCPYCSGVRIMKEGKAFCVSCGREPEKRNVPQQDNKMQKSSLINTLEKKLEVLSKELEQESDHEKQQTILKSINSLIEAINKVK